MVRQSFRSVPPFSFVTNHGLTLLCVAHDPDTRMRDIAEDVQITERAAQRIVADLIEAGYLDRKRVGRPQSLHPPGEPAGLASGPPRHRPQRPAQRAARRQRERETPRREARCGSSPLSPQTPARSPLTARLAPGQPARLAPPRLLARRTAAGRLWTDRRCRCCVTAGGARGGVPPAGADA
jgi:hypothetical protein